MKHRKKNWSNRKVKHSKYANVRCSKCNRDLFVKVKGSKSKCPICDGNKKEK